MDTEELFLLTRPLRDVTVDERIVWEDKSFLLTRPLLDVTLLCQFLE